ncbi:MAG: tandem-95 repeat protein, partial [Opitutaceae bacterium]|nr:tandem-95 repeat protein [Opitutaceae bacterium]
MNLHRLSNILFLALLAGVSVVSLARAAEPRVAIHDSELTRALQTVPATGATPTGENTTGFQWWPEAWNYFVMPESIKESLRSDGTAYVVVSDADIAAGALLDASGGPRYPILISLAAEAVGDNQLQPLRDYVAAGGTLFVGSSSFTRRPDGTARGNFGIADIMGVSSASADLDNWVQNYTIERLVQHRVSANLPDGLVIWQMPSEADEIPFGASPDHDRLTPHLIWNVAPTSATVLATADSSPMLTVNTHGAGRVIYHAAMQPLLGHGGWAPGMYAYMIFRDAILWAFEAQRAPVTRVSPWPFEYNAALSVRHDFENYQDMIAAIEASAQFEHAHGAKGDYVFCTGELREVLGNDPTLVASLRRAVQDYGATIAPHNGGLPNPVNTTLTSADYDFWHWGPDEALDTTPAGYASGKAYALESLQIGYQDTETWLAGLNTGPRIWISPYFNSTREDSLEILEQLDVRAAGEQKVGPFPHWTLSTRNANKRFPYVSVPLSDWYAGAQVAQSMEWHVVFGGANAVDNVRSAVDFYYDLGALINVYSHSSSTGSGYAGNVATDYVTYATAKPRVWATNAAGIYEWWVKRTPVQITPTLTSSGNQFVLDVAVAGATDAQTAIEFEIPDASLAVLNVLRDGAPAPANTVRVVNNVVRVLVGSTISSVQIQFGPPPQAADDSYQAEAGVPLIIGAPGLLANDSAGFPGNTLTATLVSAPTKGTLNLAPNGAFTYTPNVTASGVDTFTYRAAEGTVASQTATVSILVNGNTGALFVDDFARAGIAPWQTSAGSWEIVDGALQGSSPLFDYGYAYLDTTWTNYSVEAEVRLSAGGYGGGLGGRLNAATGAHYGIWFYPEGSNGGQLTVNVVKFRSWTDWSGTAMASAPISSVGTAAHALRADFMGNRIIVHFDGAEVIDVVDNGFDGRPAYLAGGLTADLWTEMTAHTVTIDNLVVMPLGGAPNGAPTATNDTFDAVANQPLVLGAPGVLANDSDPEGQAITAQLASAPSSGSVTLNANGSFTYTPAPGFTGAATFTYRSHDGTSASLPATVTINVAAANTPPSATNDAYQMSQAGVLQIAAPGVLANDSDPEGSPLTAQLVGAPT